MLKYFEGQIETWKTIFIFLGLVFALTSPFHYAIINLYPSRIYIGAIMLCPAIAAFITLYIRSRKISSLHWKWANWKYIRWSYVVPALYGIITYILILIFGFGSLANKEAITEWGKEPGLFGIGTLNPMSITIIGIILLGTVEVIFHAVSNVYIQKIMTPLTMKIEGTEHWLGENGIKFAIATRVFGLYFWRLGLKENL